MDTDSFGEWLIERAKLEGERSRLIDRIDEREGRIRKKLIKRFGGEFRKVPCVWRMGDKIIMHPALYAEMQRTMADRVNSQIEAATFDAIMGEKP